ncbi:MAG: hypothetical protein JKY15_06010 [Deltaproteobacteria bacterium]|nr:hypothetical protein [Deltaproteobacteria bacterium]
MTKKLIFACLLFMVATFAFSGQPRWHSSINRAAIDGAEVFTRALALAAWGPSFVGCMGLLEYTSWYGEHSTNVSVRAATVWSILGTSVGVLALAPFAGRLSFVQAWLGANMLPVVALFGLGQLKIR